MVFNQYAKCYDTFYRQKSYKKECDYLARIFKQHLSRRPQALLDLGCGTGNHLIPLVKRGFKLTGIDRSSEMLQQAAHKLKALNFKAHLIQSNLKNFSAGSKFDAAICMFSVIDYLIKTNEVRATFKNVSKHLKRNGVFVFDFWQAQAVEKFYSPNKKRIFKGQDGLSIERASKTILNKKTKTCAISYNCNVFKNKKLVQNFREKHHLRYFTIEELQNFLHAAGFKTVDVHPFMQIKGKIKSNTWDVTIVAQKI